MDIASFSEVSNAAQSMSLEASKSKSSKMSSKLIWEDVDVPKRENAGRPTEVCRSRVVANDHTVGCCVVLVPLAGSALWPGCGLWCGRRGTNRYEVRSFFFLLPSTAHLSSIFSHAHTATTHTHTDTHTHTHTQKHVTAHTPHTHITEATLYSTLLVDYGRSLWGSDFREKTYFEIISNFFFFDSWNNFRD